VTCSGEIVFFALLSHASFASVDKSLTHSGLSNSHSAEPLVQRLPGDMEGARRRC